MKKITRALLLFICCSAALLTVSCGGDEEPADGAGGQPAMGRYVEKALKYPAEDVKSATAVKKSDGSLDLYLYLGQSLQYVLYNTKDGAAYEQEDMPWFSELTEKQYSMQGIAYDGSDNKYVVAFSGSEGGGMVYSKVYRVTEDDRLEEIQMEWKENSAGKLKVYITNMEVASNGDLIMSNAGSGIVQYSPEGKFKSRYGGDNDERFTVSGDSLFIIDEASSQVIVYDLNTHEQKTTVAYDNMTRDAVLTGGSEGSLYLTDRSGVYRLAEGGNLWEKIIEGELTSLSIPSLYFKGAIEAKPGEFYVLFTGSESNSSFFKYEYDESISTLPGNELTVYTLEENNTLRQAAGEFQRKNPDTRVNIMVGIDSNSSVTKDDAVKAFNTEIIAGKGPDLILLDGMDVESYISKGILADLSGVVKEVRDSGEELLDSVINVYERDLKIFAVPAKFMVPSMWIDEEYAESVKNLKALAEFAKTHNDRQVAPFSSYRDLLKIFSLSGGPAWFDGDGNLDEKSLAEFLTCVKGIYDSGSRFTAGKEEEDERSGENKGSNAMAQAAVDSMHNESEVFDWAFGRSYTYCSNLESYNSVTYPSLAIAERKGGKAVPLPGQAENVFVPVNIIGINAKTEKPDMAQEFIRIMLSSSVQNAEIYDGFPVNIKSLEHGAEGKGNGNDDMYIMIGTSSNVTGEELSGMMPSTEELKKVMELCLGVKTPYVPDDALLEMIMDETEEYFAGNEDVEQAVSRVREKTRLRLAE